MAGVSASIALTISAQSTTRKPHSRDRDRHPDQGEESPMGPDGFSMRSGLVRRNSANDGSYGASFALHVFKDGGQRRTSAVVLRVSASGEGTSTHSRKNVYKGSLHDLSKIPRLNENGRYFISFQRIPRRLDNGRQYRAHVRPTVPP